MDTWGPLGQALECSVCLEQLDSTSRVLPCQHTFCRKCLIDIINSRKELRCPECRVLVTVPFSSLPPNILLLRILEGIKRLPPNTSAAATASASENLLNVSSQNNSQLHKDSDPFSIFSQFPTSNESAIQISSNRDLTSSERSIHTSLNPFLEPHSNAYSSVTNIQVVPSLNNSAQNNSIISNINSLSNTLSVINSPSNVLSLLHSSGSQENSHDQLLTNKSCPSAQIISSVLSSNHALNNVSRQNINLNSDYNSQISECNIPVSSSSQVINPSMTPTPVTAPVLNSLSDFPISARRANVSTLTERETSSLTSNVSNDPAVESQTIETSESPQTINSEEPSRVNERTSLVSQLPSKSLRESHLTSISSQPFVSLFSQCTSQGTL
ncbi:E3 ubiquitin-protein ligase SH3RF1 [Armadillidium nasatum]|uniref:E3 ubiquitin-protein ligase SH3RF1 n=1 Tax=Armadillidium nasatum TaxID=96803 RepID=A0A5N5TLN1_9CRUS|nr:E3 ubiquitin-protein ligase SH3RF1 [Armadillidium nasatum]